MRALALALALALAACHTAPSTKLPAKWAMADDAVAGGTVKEADAGGLHVVYKNPSGDIVQQWTDALKAEGYTATPPHGLPTMITVTFQKGDDTVSMLVSRAGDRADVLLTR